MAIKTYLKNHLTRLSLWMCSVLLVSNMMMIFFIIKLFPLKERIPWLVQFYHDSQQVVHIRPLENHQEAYQIMIESLARQYVVMRETINQQTDVFRWKNMEHFSDKELHQNFMILMSEENEQAPWRLFREKKVIRTIYIISSHTLGPSAKDIVQIEWKAVDSLEDTKDIINEQFFSSNITFTIDKKQVLSGERFINPLGFTVIYYSARIKEK